MDRNYLSTHYKLIKLGERDSYNCLANAENPKTSSDIFCGLTISMKFQGKDEIRKEVSKFLPFS